MPEHPDRQSSRRTFIARLAARVLTGCLAVMATACVDSRLERNLAANAATQESELLGLSGRLADDRRSRIGWRDALKRMEQDNLSLRLSRQQLADSKRQTRNQWLSLVPNLATFVSIGDSLSDLSNLSSASLNANLVANMNIPNPFDFHASLYAMALQQQNAVWSHELDRRRAYVQLYSAFLEEQRLATAEEALAKRKRRLASGPPQDMAASVRRLATEEMNLERRRAYQRVSVNQLLNTPGANWEPAGGLPAVSYRSRYNRLSVGERFGKLALNLQTIQIEGAILRVQRVKFQQWPSVNFGLSAPPLYSSNDGASFSSDNLQFFSGASKSFNVADIGGRESIRDANIRLQFTREQLRGRMESEIVRIREGQEMYRRLLAEEKHLLGRIRRYERPGASDTIIVAKDLEMLGELELQLAETRRQLQQLDLQFLVWDESHWNH
jgi:hypothetical protein